jgi:hypothetical protein
MSHLIPTAVKEQLESSSNDWSGIDLPVYESCFDEYGFGDWSILQQQPNPTYSSSKSGTEVDLRLLNVGDGSIATQRADIFIANTGCTSIDYELDISGVIETYNAFFEFLIVSIDGDLLDFSGATLTHADTTRSNRTYTFPNNSFEIHSQFGDRDSQEWGSKVYVPTETVPIDPGPCPTQLTFWAGTFDSAHNTVKDPNSSSQSINVRYDIKITKT